MKVFELKWHSQDEKEWVAANTNIEAIKTYLSITGMSMVDLEDEDEIIEVPESEWLNMVVTNTDYDPKDPEDWESITFAEWMKENKSPDIIAGTMYT